MNYHLRLCKGLSYSGVLSATKQRPDAYTDSETVAAQAIASGYFKLVETENAELPEAETQTGTLDLEQLNGMELSELRRLAAQMGIEAKGLKKPELVKAIASVEVTVGAEEETDEDGIDLEQA